MGLGPGGDASGPEVMGAARAVLTVSLRSDRDRYRPGQPVRLTLEATNGSGEDLTFFFPSAQRYDFEVRWKDGSEVWRWGAERGFAAVVGTERWGPGETRSWTEIVVVGLGSGSYDARAWVTSHPPTGPAEGAFEVG